VTATNPEGDFEIFLMTPMGEGCGRSPPTRSTTNSRAGRLTVATSCFSVTSTPVIGQVDYDRFTMKADGTHQRNLTRSPGFNDQDADWSPTGRRIAFASERDGDLEVYTMRPDGSRVRQLTINDRLFDGFPDWSPDGRRIAFWTDRDENFEIYSMRANGSRQVNRTRHLGVDIQPDWQPLP
jgi:Tol biopolymer transport system component